MKLRAVVKSRIEEEFGTEAVAEDHPAMNKLKEAFGDHTFFLDFDGLNIIERGSESGSATGKVVKLASWSQDRSQLQVHEPEVLPVTIDLGGQGPGSES